MVGPLDFHLTPKQKPLNTFHKRPVVRVWGDRKTERRKDRKTERHKGRKTERQKDRKTERQKDRKTERQKDRKTERTNMMQFYHNNKNKTFISSCLSRLLTIKIFKFIILKNVKYRVCMVLNFIKRKTDSKKETQRV